MMLAVPLVAAVARALAVVAAGAVVAAEAHPPATRAPANVAVASMDMSWFLCMTSLPCS